MKRMITACVAAMAVYASGETFETRDDFSITLPEGWVQIPGCVLQAYAEKVNEHSPDTPRQVYDYGYQIENDGTSMSYPYILGQFRPAGRIPSGELARYQKPGAPMDDSGLSEVSMGESTYDPENHILWTTLTMPVQEGETAKALVAVKLTELGYIRLTGCTTADSFNEDETVFREAFSSLEMGESIVYKPRFGDSMPVIGGIMTGKVLLWCIQAIVIGSFFWLIYALLKRLMRKRKA